MNRFGWGVLTAFFMVGVLAFWSAERDQRRNASPAVQQQGGSAPRSALILPVHGASPDRLIDTWQQSRDGGMRTHQAIDIPAPMGTPVLAAMAGRVEKLFVSEAGGLTAYVRSDDGNWMTYYAHLSGYAVGLREGQGVAAGQAIAFVGDTGNAGPGNTHLHFGLHRMASGEPWHQGTPVNPYPLLAGKRVAR